MSSTTLIDPPIPEEIIQSHVAGRILSKIMDTEVHSGMVYLGLSDEESFADDDDMDEDLEDDLVVIITDEEIKGILNLLDNSTANHPLSPLKLFADKHRDDSFAEFDRNDAENLIEPLLQQLCISYPDELPYIQLQGSYSEHKQAFGNFGGFASFITADEIKTFRTHDFLSEQIQNYKPKMEDSPTRSTYTF
jgi:hypothetical protein